MSGGHTMPSTAFTPILAVRGPRHAASRIPKATAPPAVVDAPLPWGRNLTGPLVLVMALGLLVEAFAVSRGRADNLSPTTQGVYWLGLLLIFAPAAIRAFGAAASTKERVTLTLLVPIALQLQRIVLYPTTFMFHDEFIHANVLREMQDSHHLFHANSLLPVTSYYPALEIATDGVQQVTGLSAHSSAAVVLVLARIVMTLSILGLVHEMTGSWRAAGIATIVYTANPQQVFFNSQFSYQSFALPLAVFALYAFASRRRGPHLWSALLLPVVTVGVVALSHHLTSMLLGAAFAGWLLFDLLINKKHPSGDRRALALTLALGVGIVAAVATVPGNPVLGYLRTIVTSSWTQIQQRVHGQASHTLFQNSAGLASPRWEQAATVAAILIVVLGLLPTLCTYWGWRHQRNALLMLLGVVALAYPIIPLGHLTSATAEVTDRASGFLFLGVGVAIAYGPLGRARQKLVFPLALGASLIVVFVGSIVLGGGPTVGQLPGPYLVSADARSIDASNLAAAHWQRQFLGANQRVYADRDSGLLAAAIGGQYTVTHVGDNIDASQILLAPTFTATDRQLIREAKIQYVIVDLRDATSLPNEQVYIESGEYGQFGRTVPVSAQALEKLANVPGVQRIYSNGDLIIYDVRSLDGS